MQAQWDELWLELRRVLPAARPVIFAGLTDPDELAKWWGPDGFTIPYLDFLPRVGAGYRIEMQPPEGDPFSLTGQFRAYEPPLRLAFTFVWEGSHPDDVETLVTLSVRDLGRTSEVPWRRDRSRPPHVGTCTGTVGPTASTSSNDSSLRAASLPFVRHRNYYGAISLAYTGGAVGMSYDYSTVWGAKNRAQSECRSRSSSPWSCHRIAWVRNGCLALAVRWDDGNIARYAWAVRNSKNATRWAAQNKCGYGCVRRAYTCTTR